MLRRAANTLLEDAAKRSDAVGGRKADGPDGSLQMHSLRGFEYTVNNIEGLADDLEARGVNIDKSMCVRWSTSRRSSRASDVRAERLALTPCTAALAPLSCTAAVSRVSRLTSPTRQVSRLTSHVSRARTWCVLDRASHHDAVGQRVASRVRRFEAKI